MLDSMPTPPPPAAVIARPVVQLAPPDPLLFAGLPASSAWGGVLLTILTVFFTLLVLPTVLSAAWPVLDEAAALPGSFLLATKWLGLLVSMAVAGWLLRLQRRPVEAIGLHTIRLDAQIGWGFLAVVCVYMYILATTFLIVLLSGFTSGVEEDLRNRIEFIGLLPTDNLGVIVLLMLAVAVQEELLFRGLLLPYLRRLSGRWWVAIAISSLIFGVLHLPQGVLGALQVTGLGVLFGLFFVQARSLLAVSLAHFLFNTLQMLMVRLMAPLFESYANP